MIARGLHTKRLLALLALTATLGLAACGGDDEGGDEGDKGQAQTEQTTEQAQQPPETESDPETESEPPADAKDPEGAFLSFQNALANGDKDAVCGSLTPTAIKQVEEASIGGKCDTWVEATVKYTSPILNLPLEAQLEKSGESWKISKLAENV